MQKQLYYEDQYLKEVTSTVERVDGNKIVLAENLLFPKTKSEPNDLGTVSDVKVIAVEKEGSDVAVTLENASNIKERQEVTEKIDWERRLKAMRLHSALHMTAGVIEKENDIRAVAGNVYDDHAELIFKSTVPEMIVMAAEDKASELTKTASEIKTYEDEKREGFRWCKVADFEPIPCGGIHVKSTDEIGEVNLESQGDKVKITLG